MRKQHNHKPPFKAKPFDFFGQLRAEPAIRSSTPGDFFGKMRFHEKVSADEARVLFPETDLREDLVEIMRRSKKDSAFRSEVEGFAEKIWGNSVESLVGQGRKERTRFDSWADFLRGTVSSQEEFSSRVDPALSELKWKLTVLKYAIFKKSFH